MRDIVIFGLVVLLSGGLAYVVEVAPAAPRDADAGPLAVDDLLAIRHPFLPTWSPDGDRVAFVWDESGTQDVWVIDGAEPRRLTELGEGLVDGLFWERDGKALYFGRDGDLWTVPVDEMASGVPGAARPVWETEEAESGFVPSPDGSRVACTAGGDVWVRDLPSPSGGPDAPDRPDAGTAAGSGEVGEPRRLTRTPELAESGVVWSPDGERLAFSRARVVTRVEADPDAGSKVRFARTEIDGAGLGVVPAGGGETIVVDTGDGTTSDVGWVDDDRLVYQRLSPDLQVREIVVVEVERGAGAVAGTGITTETGNTAGPGSVVHGDRDDKWWSMVFLGAGPRPSPDGRWIAFLSDASGWDHLYLVSPDGGPARAVTSGSFEVRNPVWAPDGRRLAFDASIPGRPAARRLVLAEIVDGDGETRVTPWTGERGEWRGTDTTPRWSPDGTRLLYQRASPQHPADLFVIDAGNRGNVPPPAVNADAGDAAPGAGAAGAGDAGAEDAARPRRLTVSLPPELRDVEFVEPEPVRYASADGSEVPAYLFVPPGIDRDRDDLARSRSRRHPAIVWVHGDGITQNFDGWHLRRDYAVYYSFHQYLLQRGYVVLAVDYRGSVGYGRDWRQGHYRDLGGRDYEDVEAGAGYLAGLGFVDPERIGVWGLSYGGFMTLQALTVTPELFACGVDVAGVPDWTWWYDDPDGPWIRGRMGTLEDDPELYRRASPIHRLDRIVRPLLVLHGTADVNVPFLESVRLVDELTRLGVDFDFEMYPGELHYFHRAHVLRDAWSRVERFFGDCLGTGAHLSSTR